MSGLDWIPQGVGGIGLGGSWKGLPPAAEAIMAFSARYRTTLCATCGRVTLSARYRVMV